MKPSRYVRMARARMHFDWDTYHQRSKAETIFSFIKRMLGEHIMSRYITTQNRETMYQIIADNFYRITRNYLVILDVFYGLTQLPSI